MAQVDFSNAVISLHSTSDRPFSKTYLALKPYNAYSIGSESGTSYATNVTYTTLTNTPSKWSYLCSGTFTTANTEFYIYWGNGVMWHVTNISFASGDTFNFVLEIEITEG